MRAPHPRSKARSRGDGLRRAFSLGPECTGSPMGKNLEMCGELPEKLFFDPGKDG